MPLTNAVAEHAGKMPSAPNILLALDVTPDASYPRDGWAFNPAALLQSLGGYDKAPTVQAVVAEAKGGFVPVWDRANNKLKVQKEQPLDHISLGPAGLAIGTSKPKVLIANTVPFLIAGVFKSKSTAETAFTATTHDITALAGSVQEAVYLVTLDAAGTVTLTKGTTATGAGNAAIPSAPASEAVVGHVRIAVDAGATDFDASSDDLDAAHLTVTYTDLAFVPGVQTEVEEGADLSTTPGALRVLIIAD